jgi:hypothetical protein
MKSAPKPPKVVQPAAADNPEVQNKVAEERRRQRMRRGSESTILSSMNEAAKQTLG